MKEDFDRLLTGEKYRHDPLFNMLNKAFDKYPSNGPGLKADDNRKPQHIAQKKRHIHLLNISENFSKNYNPLMECLAPIQFRHKDCLKVFQVIYKNCLRSNKPYMVGKKRYLQKQVYMNRPTLDNTIKELIEKEMLLERKEDAQFIYTPVLAPLSWNLSEGEREDIKREVEREIKRVEDKWIKGISE